MLNSNDLFLCADISDSMLGMDNDGCDSNSRWRSMQGGVGTGKSDIPSYFFFQALGQTPSLPLLPNKVCFFYIWYVLIT